MTIGNPTVAHMSNLPQSVISCFYTGSDALKMGHGLCYDSDRGVAADHDGQRANFVEKPSATNNLRFAGVLLENHPANSSGQSVRLAAPGSWCLVALGSDTVVDETLLTCVAGGADAGRFRAVTGHIGRGSAVALQTNASGTQKEQDANAAALDSTGKILTVSAGATANVNAGDIVHIYAGEDDGTNATTPGEYVVASVDSDTQITLTTAASNGGTMQVSYYIIRGNPTCMARLYDGEESGLVQYPQVEDGAQTTTMTGGKTIWSGNVTLTPDMTDTLDVTKAYPGMKKSLLLQGALTTQDVLISCVGVQLNGADALATLEFDGDDDQATLEWTGLEWNLIWHSGAAIA